MLGSYSTFSTPGWVCRIPSRSPKGLLIHCHAGYATRAESKIMRARLLVFKPLAFPHRTQQAWVERRRRRPRSAGALGIGLQSRWSQVITFSNCNLDGTTILISNSLVRNNSFPKAIYFLLQFGDGIVLLQVESYFVLINQTPMQFYWKTSISNIFCSLQTCHKLGFPEDHSN